MCNHPSKYSVFSKLWCVWQNKKKNTILIQTEHLQPQVGICWDTSLAYSTSTYTLMFDKNATPIHDKAYEF